MSWHMPAETAPQDRIWMAFPREGQTLGETSAEREAGYAAWAHVANTIAEFQPVSIIVDPTEMARAKRMLSAEITIHERTIDDFWMRDPGPTFVHDADGKLAAVDWIFNGWGGGDWTASGNDRDLARTYCGAEVRVSTAELPPLPDGEYYWFQLEGLDVFTVDDECLGKVHHLMETGSNDVLVVQATAGSIDQRERLIPYLPGEVVQSVDLAAKQMVVDWDPEF